MSRQRSRETGRRVQVQTQGEGVRLAVQNTSFDSHRGVSRATQDVIARLGGLAQGIVQDRTTRKFETDAVEGQRARTEEALAGTEARQEDALAGYSHAFRRGYFMTEAANKLTDTRRALHKTLAAMEPGDDPQPVIEEALASMVTDRAFQDPQVMRQITPAVNRLRDEVLSAHQKYEMAEVLTRQTENLTQLARLGIQDGSLRTGEGLEAFYETVGGEDYAYLSRDDANDILSAALVDLMETGEVDPDEMVGWLQETVDGNNVPLWDRRGGDGSAWSDRFTTAASAGARVRQQAQAEKVAQEQSDMEIKLQRAAYNGRLGEAQINAYADQWGLTGSERLQFVRHWGSKDEAGRRRLEEAAARAANRVDIGRSLAMGMPHAHTSAELRKYAEDQFQAAVLASGSNDILAGLPVIIQMAQWGVEVPQVRDLLNRSTAGNMGKNYDLYRALADYDPVLADRYVDDKNAILYAEHHVNTTRHGMTPAESLRYLPTGANKDTRPMIEARMGRAITEFARTDKDYAALPFREQQRVQARANAIARELPDADPERIMKQALRRVQDETVEVNGQRVPRMGMQDHQLPAINEFLKRVGVDAVREGVIDRALQNRIQVRPSAANDGTFVVTTETGYPLVRPGTTEFYDFDPGELSRAKVEFETRRAEREAVEGQQRARERRAARPPETSSDDPYRIPLGGRQERPNANDDPLADPYRRPLARSGAASGVSAISTTRKPDDSGPADFVDFLIQQKRGQ